MNRRITATLVGGMILGSSLGAGAQSPAAMSPAPSMGAMASMAPPASMAAGAVTDSPAANLRVALDQLLGEHIILALKATDAALGGRTDEFAAYGGLLNTNGTEVGAMIGAAFGADAQDQFNLIWSAHNGYFVDYTTGVATKDQAKMDQAVSDLTGKYVPTFSKFIADATGLPLDAVTSLITDHVLQTKQAVDDQAKGDWAAVYADVRAAFAHMAMIGDPLAESIAAKLPDMFAGDPASKAVGFRVALDQLLQEHLFLATFATGAALGGRSDEFAAAGAALNTNGTDIGVAIGSLYGTDAQDQFNLIWSAHNGFFVDYTTGVATKDQARMDKAVQDLTTVYVPQFSAFLAGATGLPEAAVADLVTHHVLTTKAVVDAQGSGDFEAAAAADQEAGRHMQVIGDALAAAIVAKIPASFQ